MSEPIYLSTEYEGPLALLYDTLHADDGDEGFWLQMAARYAKGGQILELGCGTGRLTSLLADAGYNITGLDASKDMLESCARRLEGLDEDARSRVKLVHGYFDQLHFTDHFDMVFFSCDTFQHLIGTDAQLACLTAIQSILAPRGVLIIDQDILDVEAAVETLEEAQYYEFPLSDDESWRLTVVPKINFRMGRITDLIEIERITYSGDGEEKVTEHYRSRAEMCLLWPRELFLLLRMAGMQELERLSSYDVTKFSGDEDKLIVIARNARSAN